MAFVFKEPELKEGMKESTFECKRDELTIRGTEYRPEGDNLPIAIVSHGFMGYQDTVKYYTSILAGMGYAAYCFDFNGGGVAVKNISDGKTKDMSVVTEVADLEAVIDYVSTLPYVNKNKIVLMGCSQGAFVSAIVAAKNKYPVDKLALFYPAVSIPDDARNGRMILATFDPKNVPETFLCGPMELGRRYVTDVIDMDAFEMIKGYKGKVCIVHGTDDKVVNVTYSKRAAETYKSFGADVTLHIIDGGEHVFSPEHDVIAVEKLKEFIEKD